MRPLFAAALGLAAATVTYAASPSAAFAPRAAAGEPSLEEVRAATARFKDVNVAVSEGYINPGNSCETAAQMGMNKDLGGMGIHFFRPDLLGVSGPPNPRVTGTGTHTDFRQPAILIYEPRADGSLELVAVENLVFEKAWKAAGNTDRPSFHGIPYEHMADDPATPTDEAHMFEPHFDKHIWLWRTNPKGVFTPFNPRVTCEYAKGPRSAHNGH